MEFSMNTRFSFHRYDFAAFAAFAVYALCSLSVPLTIVKMGDDLQFPLTDGGMGQGGALHLVRCCGMVLALVLCGSIAARIGKRFTMGLSMLLMGAGIFLCAFSPVYWVFCPLLLLTGFGEGICEGIATPFVQDLHPDNPERYVNVAHSFWSIGILLCVFLAGGLLTLEVHWRFVFAGCGILGLITAVLFFLREKDGYRYPESGERVDTVQLIRKSILIFKTPRFWTYCFCMFVGAGAEFCLTFWAAAYLELTFGASAFVASLGVGVIAAGMFCGRNGVALIAKRGNLPLILIICSLGTAVLSLFLAFIKPEFLPSVSWMYVALFCLLFLCGIGIAPFWPTLQVYGVNSLPELDSTLLFIIFSAMGIPGCGFFTWIIGVLGDKFGLQGAFLLIPSTMLIYALILFLERYVIKNKRPGCQAERQ